MISRSPDSWHSPLLSDALFSWPVKDCWFTIVCGDIRDVYIWVGNEVMWLQMTDHMERKKPARVGNNVNI